MGDFRQKITKKIVSPDLKKKEANKEKVERKEGYDFLQ